MSRFLLARRHPAQDVLHLEKPFTECGVDLGQCDLISEDIAARLLNAGHCHSCLFCEPVPDPATLNTRGSAA